MSAGDTAPAASILLYAVRNDAKSSVLISFRTTVDDTGLPW